MGTARLKVIQWATGNIGARSLRAVIEHPHMELAGVWVSSPDKAGLDAGALCGLGRDTGIIATNDAAALCAAQPGIRTTADLPQVIAWFGQ